MANQAVYGIVGNRTQAEKLVQALVDQGVNPHDISILSSQGEDFKEFSSTTFTTDANRNWRTEERVTEYPTGQARKDYLQKDAQGNLIKDQSGLGHEKHTKAPEGATAGATTGGIIGGTLGLLAGIGALAIPGMGPFIAAGPLMAVLSGIGAGGTLGGIIGALVGSGIPEYEAKRYENHLKEGGILLSVRALSDDWADRIKDLMQKNGAKDVTVSSEATTSKDYHKK